MYHIVKTLYNLGCYMDNKTLLIAFPRSTSQHFDHKPYPVRNLPKEANHIFRPSTKDGFRANISSTDFFIFKVYKDGK